MPPMLIRIPHILLLLAIPLLPAFAQDEAPEDAPVKMTVQVELPDVDRLADEEAAGKDKLDTVLEEMAAMRASMEQLQQTLDLLVNSIMADLETENRQLREEMDRLRAREAAGVLTLPGVPRPGPDLLTHMTSTTSETGSEPAADAPPAAFGFETLDEWGRTPDVAKQLGDNVTSLKGMVLVVPPNSLEEDLTNLGLDLRTDYANYDNINIEVFDDPEAAGAYINTQSVDTEHHVLSVSKHAASGRDLILLIDGENKKEVAF